MVAIDDIWADADAAVAESMLSMQGGVGGGGSRTSDCCDSDEEDEYGNNVLLQEARSANTEIVRMEDGDIHLCDAQCPYAVMCKKTGDLVCPFSSMVVGHVTSERTDYSTGRNAWSADPDMQGGNTANGAYWKRKIDKVAASKQAHRLSTQLDDSIMPRAKIQQRTTSNSKVKRGALCVDEKAAPNIPTKKARMSKKNVASTDQMQTLVSEAASIYTKLLVVNAKPHLSRQVKHSAEEDTPSVDRRLLNADVLFNAALKKYTKEKLEQGLAPSFDDIHNLSLTVENVVSATQHKLDEVQTMEKDRFKSLKFREAVSRLAVSLWKGVCSSPHVETARRGGDSFRPFCVGVYYSLKRGLTLSDGAVLVPAFEDFNSVFPSSKEINSHAASKALHASSHRGLCSIHRCIASMDVEKQHNTFASALRLVPELMHAR